MLLTENQIKLFRQEIKSGRVTMLVFDLETSPSKFWGWGTGEQYVSHSQLVTNTETKIITAQFKRCLIDKKAKYLTWDWMSDHGEDTSLVEETVRLLNEADIVIGQNSKAFDVKVLQERAKVLRLPPVNIDFMIDTLTASRASVKAMSHKLDYRSKQQGLGGKHKMEMQDWIDILEGRTSPEKKMIPYGLKDVEDTEIMFWRELPYYNLPKSTINKILKLILHSEDKIDKDSIVFCSNCRSKHRPSREIKKTKSGLVCQNCDLSEYIEVR